MLNQVQIIGRVGKDPDTRYMPDGGAVTNMSLATTEKWKDKNSGEVKEATEWHRVVFYGRVAEIASEYAKQGSLIFIQGKLKTRKWADKDGIDKYTTEIVADQLKLLGSKNQEQSAPQKQAGKPAQQSRTQNAPQRVTDIPDDDLSEIPF